MNKKILIIITLALFLAASGILFSYFNFKKPLVITELKDSPFSVLLQNEKQTFSESTDWYEAEIIYPKQNKTASDEIFKIWKNFTEETGVKKYSNLAEAKEGLAINVESLKYAFDADYKLTTSTNTLSYIFQIYTFTGGAHGSTQNYVVNLNEKLEKLDIEQVLPTSKLQKVSELAFIDLQKQKRERNKSAGLTDTEINEIEQNDEFLKDGTRPVRDNYNVVWIDEEDFVISFGQYQVASYAEGMFEVRIKKSDLE